MEIEDSSRSLLAKELNDAAVQHATASSLGKKAKKMQDDAREVLVKAFTAEATPFRFKGGSTYVAEFEGVVVEVTVPISAEVPAAFIRDAAGAAAAEVTALFGSPLGLFHNRFEFDAEAYASFLKGDESDDEAKRLVVEILQKYFSTPSGAEKLAPRVSSKLKKGK